MLTLGTGCGVLFEPKAGGCGAVRTFRDHRGRGPRELDGFAVRWHRDIDDEARVSAHHTNLSPELRERIKVCRPTYSADKRATRRLPREIQDAHRRIGHMT